MKHDSWDLFRPLENENNPDYPDGFTSYCERINEHVSSIPSDVLKQWVYRLYKNDNVIKEFGNINYQKVCFELEEWSTSEIMKIHSTKFGKDFIEGRVSELVKLNGDIKRTSYGHLKDIINHWMSNGTWSSPIIILKSSDFFEYNNYPLTHQLVEGHNRLSWMKYFGQYGSKNFKLASKHKLWVMKIKDK